MIAYGALHDFCRVHHIALDCTAIQEGPQNDTTWIATVRRDCQRSGSSSPPQSLTTQPYLSLSLSVREDENQRYHGQGPSKRAALAAAAGIAFNAEGVVWSDGEAST